MWPGRPRPAAAGRRSCGEGRAGQVSCRGGPGRPGRLSRSTGEEAFDGISAERSAPAGGEERLGRLAVSFVQPGSEHRHGRGRQRRDPLLAALAEAAHVGTAAEHHVLASQSDRSETRRPVWIATSSRAWRAGRSRGAVGSGQQGVDFVLGQELTLARSVRLGGMARTRAMRAACSGWRRAAKRNMECSAARRALRVRTTLPRSVSR